MAANVGETLWPIALVMLMLMTRVVQICYSAKQYEACKADTPTIINL